ncbi:hypothetical protein HYX06_04635 [Candidatus Woesearchaeota archaeon]|nr:hypothetical protein [Candidatus Woesearchaeota archaeon]
MIWTRRVVIRLTALACASALGYGAHYPFENFSRNVPQVDGKVPTDLHTHVGRNHNEDRIAEKLSQGLAEDNLHSGVLSVDDVANYHGAQWIDRGLLGRIEYNGRTGYFAKAQEIGPKHHILALFCPKRLDDYEDPRRAVEEIKKQGGLAILNHPYIVKPNGSPLPRMANAQEEKVLYDLCQMVDEIEVFNASALSLTPLAIGEANLLAQELLRKANQNGRSFKGVAVSDAHHLLREVLAAGILLEKNNLSVEGIKESIKSGNFSRYEQHISRAELLGGYLLTR